ncbi:MAG: Rab family GTPase [Promethearchaeota archaeon]
MGVQISDKSFLINNYVSELIIWDIAGHNKFETMRKHFYQGADGIILIYDITNKSSFESIKYWYKDITKYLPNIKIKAGILIGNKLDLKSERKVTKQMGSELAREFNFELIEASALTGKNIEYAFYKLNKHLIKLKSTPRMIN